jgi:DNA modification methylase
MTRDLSGYKQAYNPQTFKPKIKAKAGFVDEYTPPAPPKKGRTGQSPSKVSAQRAAIDAALAARGYRAPAAFPAPYYEKDGITIYNGDTLEIMPALGEKAVDFIFTDPPYGHSNHDGDLIAFIGQSKADRGARAKENKRRTTAGLKPLPTNTTASRTIANDRPEETDDLIRRFFPLAAQALVKNGVLACCTSGGGPGVPGENITYADWSQWINEVLNFKQMIVWDKGFGGFGWHFHRDYEVVLVAQNGTSARWYAKTKKHTHTRPDGEEDCTVDHQVENIIRAPCRRCGYQTAATADLQRISKIIPKADQHPTPKPVGLSAFFIRLFTQEGDLVLDPFMGGGSTLLAAQYMKRRAIGIEIDEHWCEVTARTLDANTLRAEDLPEDADPVQLGLFGSDG